MSAPQRLTHSDVRALLDDLAGWTGDTSDITCSYDFPEFLAGVEAVSEVAKLAEEMDHHPDIDIRWRTVTFSCSTHSEGGVTGLDADLARHIDAIARVRGAAPSSG